MHGVGIYSWPDGREYEGEYLNDKKEGYGRYVWPGNQKVYEGQWKAGQQHGDGYFTLISGKTRRGQW